MQFRLTYRGKLRSASTSTRKERHAVRRHFHRQLRMLWRQDPLRREYDRIAFLSRPIGRYSFAPLVSAQPDWRAHAELDILMLRPVPPGDLVNHAGDLDNRIKPLLDSLRMPCQALELPDDEQPGQDEDPFFVLLEDDALVTRLGVTTDRLLEPARSPMATELLITVTVRRA